MWKHGVGRPRRDRDGQSVLEFHIRSISNPDALAAYAKLAGPALTGAGGRFLARGMPAQVYEAGLKQRTVLIEFDSVEAARAAHDSPAYQEALAALASRT